MKMNADHQIDLFMLICDLEELAKKYNDIEVAKITNELKILLTSRYEGEKK